MLIVYILSCQYFSLVFLFLVYHLLHPHLLIVQHHFVLVQLRNFKEVSHTIQLLSCMLYGSNSTSQSLNLYILTTMVRLQNKTHRKVTQDCKSPTNYNSCQRISPYIMCTFECSSRSKIIQCNKMHVHFSFPNTIL